MNELIPVAVLFVALLSFVGFVTVRNRLARAKLANDAVDAMMSAKRQEMRQRFLPQGDDMEYVFLVLSEKEASDDLVAAWRKLANSYKSGTRERLWATELLLASMPMFIAGNGNRHLVWAIVQVGREAVSVKVRHLGFDLLEPRLHQAVSETMGDLVSALKKRKHEVSFAAAKQQPDLASLTLVPIH